MADLSMCLQKNQQIKGLCFFSFWRDISEARPITLLAKKCLVLKNTKQKKILVINNNSTASQGYCFNAI